LEHSSSDCLARLHWKVVCMSSCMAVFILCTCVCGRM
jgi:hypothetical protein